MKKPSRLATLLLCSFAMVCVAELGKSTEKPAPHGQPEGVQDLKIGDPAPDFNLLGIDGKRHTLADYRGSNSHGGIPLQSLSRFPRCREADQETREGHGPLRTLRWPAINPNNPDGLSIDELGYSK